MELDQAHGGTFSTFAVTLQGPLARLTLRDIDVNIEGSGIEPVIITGLDAMGRSAENEKLRYLFNDFSLLNEIPDSIRARLKESDLMSMLASGRDVEAEKIVKTEEEFQQEQAVLQQQQAQAMGQQEMAVAGAQQAAQGA
jgi:hypothetical protein